MPTARLMYACDANMYYATKITASDPFMWYQNKDGKTFLIIGALEIEEAKRDATVDQILDIADVAMAAKDSGFIAGPKGFCAQMLKEDDVTEVEVPPNFNTAITLYLQSLGINVRVTEPYFFAERSVKSAEEIEKVRHAQAINQKGFERAKMVLKEAEIGKDDILYWQGEVLTAERLRGEMNAEIARFGSVPMSGGPIVGCAAQGAEPHERGHGPLKAHELIIIDSFPQSDNMYFGDLTRTYLKGTPKQWQIDMYNAVKAGQQLGLDLVKAGAIPEDIHEAIHQKMADLGFETGKDEQGRYFGFFHGTGHSVGIEVHDQGERISRYAKEPLSQNTVVTVEPGLYYPEKGGVRIEDIVAVTDKGIDQLTTLSKEDWIID